MSRVHSKNYPDERKCQSCNWRVGRLYSFEGVSFRKGLCGDCFMDMIVEESMKVS